MGMSVWMARTVPVFSAVLKTAGQELGDMGGYTFVLPKWTHMHGSSSPLPSACSIWFTGSPTFTCKRNMSIIGSYSLNPMREDVLCKSTSVIPCVPYNDLNLFLCSNLVNCINGILFAPNSPVVRVI